jgi:tRNA G46 methylase TrmB
MQANSRPVSSTQQGPHPKLARQVLRHLHSRWQRPASSLTPALRTELEACLNSGRPLVLDAFCGTGFSTRALAARHPDCLVLGVDKSADRLSRHGDIDRDNYRLLRARCEEVWDWLAERNVRLRAHYLLYPNPWPKPGQLGRRVHGHPAFPRLLQLGGAIELRCNWQPYAEEFGRALALAGIRASVGRLPEGPALSLFERKYRASGHALWRCQAHVTGGGE